MIIENNRLNDEDQTGVEPVDIMIGPMVLTVLVWCQFYSLVLLLSKYVDDGWRMEGREQTFVTLNIIQS